MITLADLLGVVDDLRQLQLDQVHSLADEDTDLDNYNLGHVRTIIRTLEKHNNHPFDFSDTIAFAKELFE
tara:strand:- start:2458 stop:2667 length:210 start_codon:yes stop_codon:yes gene_type:complete